MCTIMVISPLISYNAVIFFLLFCIVVSMKLCVSTDLLFTCYVKEDSDEASEAS